MNDGSENLGPISLLLPFARRSGEETPQKSQIHLRDAAEEPDDCIWFPASAARAADCAAEMRRRIAEKIRNWETPSMFPGDACLAPPILDRHLGDMPSEVLLSWVHFNPFRPIVSNLWYVELPGSKEGLLTFFKEDPFQKTNAVFALIPGAFNEAAIAQAATALFASNGHESCVLFQGLPTSIGHRENWDVDTIAPLFGSKIAKALFRFPVVRCWKTTDMQVFCEHLRSFPDPWERSTAAVKYRDQVAAGDRVPQTTEFSESGYDEWFELVTDPVQVAAERRNFGRACLGAKLFYEREQKMRDPEGAFHHDSK